MRMTSSPSDPKAVAISPPIAPAPRIACFMESLWFPFTVPEAKNSARAVPRGVVPAPGPAPPLGSRAALQHKLKGDPLSAVPERACLYAHSPADRYVVSCQGLRTGHRLFGNSPNLG